MKIMKTAIVSVLLLIVLTTGNLFSQNYYFAGWESGTRNTGLEQSPGISYSINNSSTVTHEMTDLHNHEVIKVPWARSGDYVLKTLGDGTNYGTDQDFASRSEIDFMGSNYRYYPGDEHYFSMSFRPDETWDNITKYSIIIAQWKMFSGGPHAAIRLSNLGDYKIHFNGPEYGNNTIGTAKVNEWSDIKIYFKKSLNSDGITKIWLNGELVFEHYGVNLLRDAGGYCKVGMYTEIRDKRIIYFDDIAISNFIDVPLEEWATGQSGNKSPTAELTSPKNGEVIEYTTTVPVTANASDEDGSISRVEFYDEINGTSTLLKTISNPPYTFDWEETNITGNHNIGVKAYDNAGKASYNFNEITIKAPDGVKVFQSINDAYIRDDSNIDNNYNKDHLIIKGAGIDHIRESVLQFDKGENDLSTISKAVIRLKTQRVNSNPVPISLIELGDNWEETTVTWNTIYSQVYIGNTINTQIISELETWYEFDVTDYVKNQASDDNKISFLIKDISESDRYIYFYSNYSNPHLHPALVITNSSLSTKNITENKLSGVIYPNPAKDILNIEVPNNDAKEVLIEIYSLQGQILLKHIVENNETQRVDISSLPSGNYIVCIKNGGRNNYKKLVIL